MDLKAYMYQLGEIIGFTLTSEGFGARLLRAKQGPMTLNYKIQLERPKQGDIEKVLRMGPLLESQTNLAPVRLSREVGSIVVEFPSPEPVTPHASLLASETQGATLCVGFNRWGEPVFLSLPRFPNLLVSGPPGSGKSSSMRSMAYSAILRSNSEKEVKVELVVCAEKIEHWSAFETVQGYAGFFTTQSDINKFLRTIAGEMRQLAANNQRFEPAKLVILDDLMSILSGNSEAVSDIVTLVSVGRAVGVYILIGTQSVGSKAGTGGQQIEDNMVARLLYRASSRSAAARATGESSEGLDALTTQPGDALLVMGHEKIRIATGYVTNEDIIKDLPRRNRRPRYLGLLGSNQPGQVANPTPVHRGSQVVTQEPPTVQSQVTHASMPELPQVRPARALTNQEAAEVLAWLVEARKRGVKISKNHVLMTVFGGKNDKLNRFLMDALGSDGVVYFPPKGAK